MKKHLLLLAALAFGAFTFTACGDDDNEKPSGQTTHFDKPVQSDYAASYSTSDRRLLTDFGGGGVVAVTYDADLFAHALARPKADGVVTKDGKSYFVGYYTPKVVAGGVEYTIPNFGVIVVKGEGANVVLTLTTTSGEELVTEAEAEGKTLTGVETTDLCRTWDPVSTYFQYYEYERGNTAKQTNAYGAQFNGCNLEEMADWLLKNHNVDIMDDLAAKKKIEAVTFTEYGSFSLLLPEDVCVGKWSWNNQSKGTLKYSWSSDDMKTTFENGNALIEYATRNGNKYCTLTLEGDLLNAESGTPYRVKLVVTMREHK